MMKLIHSSETMVITYKTTHCHNPECHDSHFHCCKNLKPQTCYFRLMDLKDIGHEGVDWTHLVQDMFQWRDPVNMVINIWVP
jgi:hypothetical protein